VDIQCILASSICQRTFFLVPFSTLLIAFFVKGAAKLITFINPANFLRKYFSNNAFAHFLLR